MFKTLQNIVLFICIIAFTSCGEYQKALKSDEVSVKFKVGTALYDSGKFDKAQRLFIQIVPEYRGKPQAEKLMFMYSDTYFQEEDYNTAAFQFDRFVVAYPNSEKLDIAAYKSARSSYEQSPVYSKDQKDTYAAITKLQGFINTYPESEKLEEVNKLSLELEDKLEFKAFEIARQYHKISDYKAALKSFDNFILDFPGSKRKSEVLYLKYDAAYLLAVNSVEQKKEERLNVAKKNYEKYKKIATDSTFVEEADKSIAIINKELENYSK